MDFSNICEARKKKAIKSVLIRKIRVIRVLLASVFCTNLLKERFFNSINKNVKYVQKIDMKKFADKKYKSILKNKKNPILFNFFL